MLPKLSLRNLNFTCKFDWQQKLFTEKNLYWKGLG